MYRRTLAVLELDRGGPSPTSPRMLGVTRQSVYYWVAAYVRDHDPSVPRATRTVPAACPADRADRELSCASLLGRSPQELGYPHTEWTVPLLQQELERPRAAALRRHRPPRAAGGSGTPGSGPATPSTPTPSAGKKRRIRRQIRGLPPRSVVLAEDETDLLLFPPLRAAWSPRGEPAEVLLSGRNARRVVFGAMNLRTGTRLFLPGSARGRADFQAFLREVRRHYRGWHVALLLDEDPGHTAKGSVRLAEGHDAVVAAEAVAEAEPDGHAVGPGQGRGRANKQYATIDEQVDRFLDYLEGLSGREALHTSGVLSDDFWLKSVL